jgi:hypothetical protein
MLIDKLCVYTIMPVDKFYCIDFEPFPVMASDPLQQLWESILPLSSLPKTGTNSVKANLPPLHPIDKAATTKRMNHELTIRTVDKLAERVESMIESVNEAKLSVIQTNGKLNEAMDQALESHTSIGSTGSALLLNTDH